MNAKYFVKVDSYWAGSIELFFGPYETKAEAEAAADKSGAGRPDLGQGARDIRYQTAIRGIYNTTQARRAGMRESHTVPARVRVPSNTDGLHRVYDEYEA